MAEHKPGEPYAIPEKNMPELERRLSVLSQRARMLGLEAITWRQVGEEYRTVNPTPDRLETVASRKRFVLVEVYGTAPKIGGWTFVAALDHMASENGEALGNIIKALPDGPAIPEAYRKVEALCQHCGTVRQRNRTYVLVSDAGEWKQVGSSCLRDFLGHADPQAIAEMLERLWSALRDGEEDPDHEPGSGRGGYYPLKDILANVAAIIRAEGWVSLKTSREHDGMIPTVSRLYDNLWPAKGESVPYPAGPEDEAEADATIEWAIGLATTTRTDYEHNLVILAQAGYAETKHWGLAASMVAARRRALGMQVYKERAVRAESQWQGEIGERITRPLEVVKAITTEDWGWGEGHLYVMVDAEGNDYVWHSSRNADLGEGDKAVIKATVKEHGIYNGRKQTKLTRGKVIEAPSAPVAETSETSDAIPPREFQVGQRVEFHSEWPFAIHTGTVKLVVDRRRDGGSGMETAICVDWDDGTTTIIPSWNQRLKVETAKSTEG